MTTLKFIDGKAIVKNGRKIIAKVYDREVYYRLKNVKCNCSYPYSLEMCVGQRDCDSIEECIKFIEKYS